MQFSALDAHATNRVNTIWNRSERLRNRLTQQSISSFLGPDVPHLDAAAKLFYRLLSFLSVAYWTVEGSVSRYAEAREVLNAETLARVSMQHKTLRDIGASMRCIQMHAEQRLLL
jgi:hypothetical protein